MNYDDCRAFIAAGALCSVCRKPATDAQRLEVLVAQLERALAESERAWKGE